MVQTSKDGNDKVSKDTFFRFLGSLLKFNFGYIILLVSYIFLEEGYYERF